MFLTGKDVAQRNCCPGACGPCTVHIHRYPIGLTIGSRGLVKDMFLEAPGSSYRPGYQLPGLCEVGCSRLTSFQLTRASQSEKSHHVTSILLEWSTANSWTLKVQKPGKSSLVSLLMLQCAPWQPGPQLSLNIEPALPWLSPLSQTSSQLPDDFILPTMHWEEETQTSSVRACDVQCSAVLSCSRISFNINAHTCPQGQDKPIMHDRHRKCLSTV